ncbi:MAG: MFS transporter [Pseudomonadota bacterium]
MTGAGVGIAFGSAPFFAAGFALLAAGMAHDFGWTQPQVAQAATIFLLLQTITYPICGWPLDRFGSRRFAVASIVMFAVALVLLSQVGSLIQFYLAFALIGLVSAGTNVLSYARALALWFNRKRGLALGFAASAQAVGAFLIPIVGQKIIAEHGWSVALLVLAAIEIVVCLPLVAWLVKDSPAPYGLQPDGVAPAAATGAAPSGDAEFGMDVGAIVRTTTFWKLAVAFAMIGMSFYAIAPNVVYILTKTAGMSHGEIAKIQAVVGIAVLFGRIGFGYLLDRVHAPVVGVMTVAMSACCALVYATQTAPNIILLAAIMSGFALGGETDLLPYLASRYFGTESVSRIFGWFLFAFFLGATVGPMAFAWVSAACDSVVVPLVILAALQVIPALLFLSLGRYPTAEPEQTLAVAVATADSEAA